MIYTGLNRTGEIETVKAHGGGTVGAVYGGINESNPIYYKTRTITGQTPLSYKALSKPLSDYLIFGNTIQDGTPTPDYPVDVQGVGERTENLFDGFDYYGVVPSISNGNNADYSAGASTDYIKVDNPLITLSKDESFKNARIYIFLYDDNKTFIGYVLSDSKKITSLDISNYTSAKFARIRVDRYYQYAEQYMLNTGSTSKPYEPYGYKLPVTIGGTEYPIYLGQVPTTRRIKKLVLTGNENWIYREPEPSSTFFLEFVGPIFINNHGLCTHYLNQDSGSFNELADKHVLIRFANSGTKSYIGLRDSSITSTREEGVSELKEYLSAQYANGTPVTVWYVLAEPETGIVNEPLHKIGDYADTITMAQAGITIPTVAGTNTLTVDTTVQPSAVSITGNIKEVST